MPLSLCLMPCHAITHPFLSPEGRYSHRLHYLDEKTEAQRWELSDPEALHRLCLQTFLLKLGIALSTQGGRWPGKMVGPDAEFVLIPDEASVTSLFPLVHPPTSQQPHCLLGKDRVNLIWVSRTCIGWFILFFKSLTKKKKKKKKSLICQVSFRNLNILKILIKKGGWHPWEDSQQKRWC